jgi:PRC-barrel domain
MTLEEGAYVVTSDGERIGTVKHVLADEDNDIFDGLVVDTDNGNRFVDAPDVEEIYERAVVLTLAAAQAQSLPEPGPAPAVMDSGEPESALQAKLRRAWDLISGNY